MLSLSGTILVSQVIGKTRKMHYRPNSIGEWTPQAMHVNKVCHPSKKNVIPNTVTNTHAEWTKGLPQHVTNEYASENAEPILSQGK